MCLGLVRYSVRISRHPCQFGIIPMCYPSLVIVQLLLTSQNPAQNVLSPSVFKFTSVVSSLRVLCMYVYLSTSLVIYSVILVSCICVLRSCLCFLVLRFQPVSGFLFLPCKSGPCMFIFLCLLVFSVLSLCSLSQYQSCLVYCVFVSQF